MTSISELDRRVQLNSSSSEASRGQAHEETDISEDLSNETGEIVAVFK